MPKFTLKTPLTLGVGDTAIVVNELTIPETPEIEGWMVLESVENAQRNEQSTILTVLAALTKQPYSLIRKIRMNDLNPMQDTLNTVMGNATT